MTAEKSYEVCQRVAKYLSEKNVSCVSDVCPTDAMEDAVEVWIDWGDWKHEHKRVDWLMAEAGAVVLGEAVTEDDGSDCYSAFHMYLVDENFLKGAVE